MNKINDFASIEGWDSNIPWDYIEQVALVDFQEKFKGITEEQYKFIADDANRQAVIDSAYKNLQKTNPETASYEKAEVIADVFRSFAKVLINDLDKLRKL